jgi:hypothetical protein
VVIAMKMPETPYCHIMLTSWHLPQTTECGRHHNKTKHRDNGWLHELQSGGRMNALPILLDASELTRTMTSDKAHTATFLNYGI